MRIFLKEATDLEDDTISTEIDSSEEVFSDVVLPEELSFIVSNELNELRDVIYNLDEDIHILLLNDDLVVLVKEDEENKTLLYCLTPDEEEFSFVEMPLSISEIVGNNNVIKYFPDQLNENHSKIVELFKHQIPNSEEDEVEDTIEDTVEDTEGTDSSEEDDSGDVIDDTTSVEDEEEEDKDVKVNIKVK